MPEIHPFKRSRVWTLREAADHGQIIVITCDLCRITHNYLPADLDILCGDQRPDRLLCRFRCEGCGKTSLRMTLHVPHGSEFGVLKIRRLKHVRTIKVPIWSDDLLT